MQNRNQKFKKEGMGIVIPLGYKDYQVRANVLLTNREALTYDITLEIGITDIPNWHCIDGDVFTLTSEKDIKMDTFDLVMDKFASGYFKRHMDSLDDEIKASELGFEILERERIKKI